MDPLNLPGIKPLDYRETAFDIKYICEPDQPAVQCSAHPAAKMYRFGTRQFAARDIPHRAKRVLIDVTVQRWRCAACKRIYQSPVPSIDTAHRVTVRMLEWVCAQSIAYPFAHVAENTGLSDITIRRMFAAWCERMAKEIVFETPVQMGIDEIHVMSAPRLVVTNLEKKTLIEMLPSRTFAQTVDFLDGMPNKERITHVAMDMWPAYRKAVYACLPGAMVIIDKFHVVKMLNYVLNEVRKEFAVKLPRATAIRLKGQKKLLEKRQADLTPEQAQIVQAWLAQYPPIKECYDLKESFYDIYDAPDRATAEQVYLDWCNTIPLYLRNHMKDVISAIKRCHKEVFNYFECRITNAFTEGGMNRYIRDIHRDGRGYSFEVLRAKILYKPELHKWKKPPFAKLVRTKTGFALENRAPDALPRYTWGVNLSTLAMLASEKSVMASNQP